MTELELYKFINTNSIEWHKADNEGTPDIFICVAIYVIDDFYKLLRGYIKGGDEGIECRLMDGYFVFWMNDLCDHYGIEPDNVFTGEEQ